MRNKSIIELEAIADFYFADLSDLMDNPEKVIKNSPHKLNHEKVSKMDFDSISRFGRIIRNYLKMQELRPLSEKRNDKLDNLLT